MAMNNIHTLDSLNNNNTNSNTIIITPSPLESVNNGTQLLPVLKLRANEIKEVQSSLDRVVEEHLQYYKENGSSSLSESFPSLYPPAIEDENTVTSLFDIIKNIYNSFINSGVDIDETNINCRRLLSNLIKNDPRVSESDNLTDEIKEVLNNVISDLNNSINTNNLKPLGKFGDITLNELILKGQNLDFSFLLNNQEIMIYPLKLIPIGIVYGTIIRLFMKHCDDYNSIQMERNPLIRNHFLRIRRINIAATLAITAPIATILFLKLGRLSIFDGIKLGLPAGDFPLVADKDKIVALPRLGNSELLNNFLPLITTLLNKNKHNYKNKYPKIILLILFIICLPTAILFVRLDLYNIFTSNIFIYLICFIWLIILIFTLIYNSLGYFILLIKNEINIDLNKIRIKFIRNTIEDFIVIRNNTIDKEKMKKYFLSHLYLSLFLIILSFLLFLF